MGRPLHELVIERPATSIIATILVAVWGICAKKGLGYGELGVSFTAVAVQGQLWRAAVAQVCHVDLLHLAFNVSALWSLGGAEVLLGHAAYTRITTILFVLETPILLSMYYGLSRVQFAPGAERYLSQVSVGYSGVLFGWFAVIPTLPPRLGAQAGAVRLLGLPVPPLAAPFAALVFTSLLVPRASFLGHLAGIVAGFAVGGCAWVAPWALTWPVVGAVGSLAGAACVWSWVRERGGRGGVFALFPGGSDSSSGAAQQVHPGGWNEPEGHVRDAEGV
ncbi:unnamed protein product [Pedinophyceae sp. YPF-701]|nr:unnamed protein product [Pedinophyceae sp. YPF-701]